MREDLIERLKAAGDEMLPDALAPVSAEWYQLCERASYVDKIKISGELAEAIVAAVCATPAAARQAAAALEAAREDASAKGRALLWLAGNDSGSSSIAICHHMIGMKSDGSFPWDPSDLGRCLRLLERFPEWKPRIGEMARYSQTWAALSERWGEIAATMADEVGIDWSKGRKAPLTYAAMKDAIDQARGKGGGEVEGG